MSGFMKICPFDAELFQADGRLDTTEIIVYFHSCWTRLKMYILSQTDR